MAEALSTKDGELEVLNLSSVIQLFLLFQSKLI